MYAKKHYNIEILLELISSNDNITRNNSLYGGNGFEKYNSRSNPASNRISADLSSNFNKD